MAKILGLQNIDTKQQVLLAALILIALAAFLLLRHYSPVNASADSGPAPVNLTAKHDSQLSEGSSAPTEGSSDSGQSSGSSSTNVTVNGRHIDIPANGSVSQTVIDENGTTTIDAHRSETSSGSGGQAGNSSSSTLNVQVNSSSTESL